MYCVCKVFFFVSKFCVAHATDERCSTHAQVFGFLVYSEMIVCMICLYITMLLAQPQVNRVGNGPWKL